jgi:hypothetical protein
VTGWPSDLLLEFGLDSVCSSQYPLVVNVTLSHLQGGCEFQTLMLYIKIGIPETKDSSTSRAALRMTCQRW